MGKDVYVTKGKLCFYSTADATISYMEVPQLKSNQREADPRIAFHAIFASSTEETSSECVVADDTDIYIYIYILYVSQYFRGKLYFRQGTGTSKDGITYHDVQSLSNHLGEDV